MQPNFNGAFDQKPYEELPQSDRKQAISNEFDFLSHSIELQNPY